ncbi:MAG: hypothetical protein KAI53_02825 [Candidatus Aenigmarchaeota archaeon]|nr:hypothetical protein [Candidatus Aenigmarchaeota archaeon]
MTDSNNKPPYCLASDMSGDVGGVRSSQYGSESVLKGYVPGCTYRIDLVEKDTDGFSKASNRIPFS